VIPGGLTAATAYGSKGKFVFVYRFNAREMQGGA